MKGGRIRGAAPLYIYLFSSFSTIDFLLLYFYTVLLSSLLNIQKLIQTFKTFK